ncbi:surfeit locus 5 subunit 22 of mediator complex domain-containing protein [Fusarium phyllophilum]|uniref:Surfeit locus 5 subunit 22 of mediator complex domain-containing protein n=1 Tax=Fusarium phyllophilum TaxID=47803 RepID=A0A8H5KBZ3_9HYPO|nr:surfeit locus 5 subunit 22 of mediator complex domain-containing protein [Fusarium phyllophilum]
MDTSAPTNLMDKHQKIISEILRSYRDLMLCVTVNGMDKEKQGDYEAQANKLNYRDPDTMAAAGLRTQRKFDELYESIKELLALTRTIKELWVFGPVDRADEHRKQKEAQIDRDVAEITTLFNKIDASSMRELAEKNGGTWEPQGEAALTAPAPTGN